MSTADGGRWLTESVEVGPNMGPLFVKVPIIEVRGTVRLGSRPLAARLSFGGKYGPQKVYLVADEEGEFAGPLPRAGTWDIAVEVDEPPIRRDIQQEVEEGEPLDLVVRGVVVDEEGKAVRQAIVRVRNVRQTRMQADLRTDEDGRFESVGLPTGRTVLMAEAYQHTSAPHELVLEEDREPPEVRLVVRRNTKVEGRVVSETGGGVPGAKVTVMSVEALSMGGPSLGTDAEGHFEAELPPGSRNLVLTVAAPGYAFRALQTPFDQGPLAVTVAQASGTLILVLPENLSLERWNHKKPLVFHAGGIVSLFALIEWAFLHGQTPESEGRYVVPQVEPGRYAACLAPLDAFRPLLAGVNPGVPCVAGDLPMAGELTLSLRDASMK